MYGYLEKFTTINSLLILLHTEFYIDMLCMIDLELVSYNPDDLKTT